MKQITFITMFVLISIGINAQTLEECRQLAREHYPEIKQYNLISQNTNTEMEYYDGYIYGEGEIVLEYKIDDNVEVKEIIEDSDDEEDD